MRKKCHNIAYIIAYYNKRSKIKRKNNTSIKRTFIKTTRTFYVYSRFLFLFGEWEK